MLSASEMHHISRANTCTPRAYELWETLTPQGKRICRHVCASPGVELPGAGVVHPLSSVRAEASKGLDAIQAEEMAIRARGEHVVQQLAEQGAKL